MNKNRYQLVFSKIFGMLVPVSEAARSHSNNPLRMRNHLKLKLCIATFVALAYSNFVAADPAGLIPTTLTNAVISNTTVNSMTITQTAPKAVLDWQRLNLNAGELLRFNQQGNRNWSALNRIYDLSPSILNGTVQADGNVYFINTNGIIFGQNAQFNVGSLYAGSLDITNTLFNEGLNTRSFEPAFQGLGGFVRVDKGAQITTVSGGRVMLFAPEVTNNGVINTPDGQTILAAGKKVYLQSSEDPAGFLVEVDGGGTATNLGKIVAERGNITMMGLAVNQQGTLSATTSVRANGSIRLLAQESVRADNPTLLPTGLRNGVVTLAKDSLTEVAPEYNNKEETIVSQPFKTSNITVEASLVNIDGKVSAKGGNVVVKTDVQGEAAAAQLNSANPTRIYLGNNAEIDVSGVDATAPMSRNQLEIQLFSEQLKDAPILRGGGLFKDTIYVDARKGTDLLDIQPFLDLKGATVAEKMTNAGTIQLATQNDLIVSQGAKLDVSGGSITYEAGTIKETNLLYNGKLVPISEAKPDVPYSQVADIYTVKDPKWGITRGWALGSGSSENWGDNVPNVISNAFRTTVVGGFVDGYLEGFNAGKVDLTRTGENTFTNNIMIAGKLLASTKIGTQQFIDQYLPRAGELVLSANNLAINKNVAETYAFDAALPDSTNFVSSISSDFAKQGFNKLDFTKVENLAVNDKLQLKPEGALNLGRTAIVNADIIAPSSNVNAIGLTVADGVTISTAGTFTNDNAGAIGQYSRTAAVDGGSINATTLSAGKNVLLDTSAGAWVDNKGVLHQGNAGNIKFALVGDIKTGTQFQAYGFKKNGELSVDFLTADLVTKNLNIAGNNNTSQTDTDIGLGFFNSGAFSKYTLSAANVNIGDNAQAAQAIDGTQKNWVMNSLFANLAGGQAMSAVATPTARPNFVPNPTSISISASNPQEGGVLNLAENTTIKTDIGGSVSLSGGKQVNVLGDITTPGGNINLRISDNDTGVDLGRSQMVFVGEKAQLSATGASISLPNSLPSLLNNRIVNAGKITINQPGSDPQKGAVIIKNGAVLDVSGASVLNDTKTNNGFLRETLHGDAGTIAVFSSDASSTFVDGMLLDGTFKGAASGTGRDGTLALTSTATEFNVTQQKQLRATTYTAGQELDLTDDKAQISVEQVQQGGFANLTIKQTNFTDSIQLENGVDLKLAGNLSLDSSLIGVKDNGNVKLAASHVTLKSQNTAIDTTALAGEGQLSINVKQVYFDGMVAVAGVNKTNITASQDITGKGTQIRSTGNTATDGGLVANGEINLTARQVYPNTASKLRFEAVGDNSKITINKSGETIKPVLAAGGEIAFVANDIVQSGNVSAALGQIIFDGKNSVKLTQGSSTSVSANGQMIPFATTQTGGEVYDGVIGQANVLLDKAINIKSNNIDLQQNATLDLSAGGDLFAYEFVPGIGGSKDILAQPNTYAIIPTLSKDYAPFDQLYTDSSAKVGVGQSVYLTGVPGLASGNYTLLPARYALVPGALMVEANVANTALLPGATVAQLDGSTLTTGYRTDLSTGARDANWSTFKVTDGAIFRPAPDTVSKAPSQYLITSATKFFANPFKTNGQDFSLPSDVARLSLDANKLNLQSNVVATKQTGGDGLKVDISATNVRVVNAQDATDTESLQLTVNSLNALKADSVLLGGSRQLKNGVTKITTSAETVSFENNASNTIKQPEIIATASKNVTVKSAAVIDTGAASTKPNKLTLETQGYGSLLALSSLSEISYSRQGGSATSTTGELNVEAGSALKAGNSIVLDATKLANLDGNLGLQDGGSATFGANRILLGNAPTNVAGLNVDTATIAALGKLKSLTLNSYNNIDTFGTVNFGNDQLNLSMNAAGIVGHLANGETVAPPNAAPSIITAKNFTLKNTQDATFTLPTDPSGRALEINAATVTFDGDVAKTGKVTIDGFNNASINANEIRVAKQGELNFNVAETTLRAGRIAAETASNYQLKSDKKLSILPLANATLAATQSVGAKLDVAARDLTVAGTIDVTSGALSLTSTNDLTVSNTAKVNAGSAASTFYNTTEYAPAGSVALNSSAGNVNVAAGAVVDVTSKGNTDAGLVKVSAVNGTVNLAGELKGAATGTGKGGVLEVDVKTLADLTATNTKAIGFDEGRQYRVRTGDVSIAGTGANALKARETVVSADAGKITVTGEIVATAPKNSRIGLHAGNGVTLENTAKLEAKSTLAGEAGGKVEISTTSDVLDNTPDKLNFKAGSKVDVSGGTGGQGGKVKITAPRTLDNSDIEIAQMGTQFIGVKDKVELNALKAYDKTSIEVADRTQALNEAQSFMVSALTNGSKGLQRLGVANNPAIAITPGLEFRNKAGNLTLPSDWSLYDAKFDPTTGLRVTDATLLASGLNAAGKPLIAGTLNLRASGNVLVNGTLNDGFSAAALTLVGQAPAPAQAGTPGVEAVFDADGTEITPAIEEVPATSAKAGTGVVGLAAWAYNIVAGADFANSKPLSMVTAAKDPITGKAITGNITIANNKGIRTGTGDINLAAGGDLNMGGTGTVIYTAGRQAAELAGFDLPNATKNPLYLADGGDISITTKGNINGAESNAGNRQLINQWLFRQGGGSGNKDTSWWVLPHLFKQSLATLGGGDIAINAGGDISNFSASAPTNARFDTNGTSGNKTINGGGDVRVQAGGNINNGVYFVGKGNGEIIAEGSIQKQGNTFGTTLALQDGSFNVKAGQAIEIEAVINPTLVMQSTANATLQDKSGENAYFNTYSTASKVNVTSLNGDIAFGGNNISTKVSGLLNNASETLKYAPGQLNIIAHNGDINMGDNVLMPSPNGDLKVLAADNLSFANLVMSDADVSLLPSIAKPVNQSFIGTGEGKIGGAILAHATQLLHQNSANPVLIVAEKGSINEGNATPPNLVLPKETKLVAGQQVGNINLVIQNNNASDISLIKAGEDVKVGYVTLAGPGELLVQAGRNIDLSSSKGDISTTGQTANNSSVLGEFSRPNTALPAEGASITLQAGLGKGADVQGYVNRYILPTGAGPATVGNDATKLTAYRANTTKSLTEYMRIKTGNATLTDAEALNGFKTADLETQTIFANRHLSGELIESAKDFAKAGNHNRGNNAIAALFPQLNQGDILLFASKVTTNSGGSVDMLAPGGLINVGAPGIAFKNPDFQEGDIGIITEKGGAIRAVADKDFQVNQSKVITQFGSDIAIWSSNGTIDAGRGSKTATSIPERIIQTDADGNTTIEVRGVAAGSGIRAQSYDPDGPNGAKQEPKKGSVFLTAPRVDAGEAGIEAGDLFIVAPIVLNATNIQVQGASSGVPIAASSGVAGAGVSSAPDAVNSAAQAVSQALTQSSNQTFSKPKLPSIISVDVISIGDGQKSSNAVDEEVKRKQKKPI